MAVIIKPEQGWQDNCDRSETQASGQREDIAEDRNATSNDERDNGETNGAPKPGHPVNYRVGLKMRRVAKDADEDVLRRDMDLVSSSAGNNGQGVYRHIRIGTL